MTSVGELLHCERVGQGRELSEIAEELCITQRYLRAIEKDDIESLPGKFFYRSFVKQYATLLGVDSSSLDRAMAPVAPDDRPAAPPAPSRQTATLNITNPVTRPVSQDVVRGLDPIVADANRRHFGDRRPGLSIAALVAVLLGCSVFYGWWNRAPKPAVIAKTVLAEPTPAPAPPSAVQLPAASSDSAIAIPVSDTTAVGDDVNQVVLNLNATEKTWLSITSDGKVLFSGILEPSQTKILHGHDEAKIKVGNAGGLEVRWNGKPIGPIGPRGQVRVIKFTPENFQIMSPSTTL